MTNLSSPRFPKCFLSGSFSKEDRGVFEWFRKIAEAVDLDILTGEEPSTQPLPDTIRSRIYACDGFVALLTRRDKIERGDDWRPPTWVEQEVALAFSMDKPMALFVEDGVRTEGLEPHIVKYERFRREDLGTSAPTVVRYLVALRNRLSPPSDATGDVATLRALLAEISGISQQIEIATPDSDLSSIDLALLTARSTGRLFTLGEKLRLSVEEAYQARESVGTVIKKIRAARENLFPHGKRGGWLFDEESLPPLPPPHPLLEEFTATKTSSLQSIRKSTFVILRAAYPELWVELRKSIESLPDSREKNEWKAVLDATQ